MNKDTFLVEASWEVCNKVGGIHTVITSKAQYIQREFEDYVLVGPYFYEKASKEFIERVPPSEFKGVFSELKSRGILCHYGTWLISSKPNVVLLDFSSFVSNKNNIKTKLWEKFKIDSLFTNFFDFDQPVIWAYAVGMFVDLLSKSIPNKQFILQAHEWLSGASILYLKMNSSNVKTVFTTHATVLGRTLANSNINFYDMFDSINPDEEAYKYKVQAKHQLEKASALNTDVFTTVSEITNMEASHFLGRKADIIVANGLNIDKFPTYDELAIRHKLYKNKIKEFMLYYFFPYYSFDIDNTIIYFLLGRYEFKAKGIDVFIKALGRLNERLKRENSNKTVLAFLWVPANVKRVRPELLEAKTYYDDLKSTIDDKTDDLKQRIMYLFLSKKEIKEEDLFDNEFLLQERKTMLHLSRSGNPPLSTHELYDEEHDAILNSLRSNNLLNRKEDKVKVVFYPIYLTGADGLLDLSYYESITASHLGIFPSFYEPWGYTPVEAAASAISSITTDLAGFGRFISHYITNDSKTSGIFVLNRLNRTDDEVVSDLADIMYSYYLLDKSERIKNKIEANKLSKLVDWSVLVKNYLNAYSLALSR